MTRHLLSESAERSATDVHTIHQRVTGVVMPSPGAAHSHRAVDPDTKVLPSPRPRTYDAYLFAAELGTEGVATWIAPVEQSTCTYCQVHPTSVRVYGDPDPDPSITFPMTVALCCRCCAPGVIAKARSEQRVDCDRDIDVDLCNLKGEWK